MTNKHNDQAPMTARKAVSRALISMLSMMPMLIGVIGLVGIIQTYVTPEMLSQLFGYSLPADIATGTLVGAVSSGNPAVSYIVADELLGQGVSLYAVSAFVLAWVTLGLVQLPAEVSVFGARFTLYKNILTLFSTLTIAYLAVITARLITS